MNIANLSAPAARLLVALLTGTTDLAEAAQLAGITRRQTAWQVKHELTDAGWIAERDTSASVISLVGPFGSDRQIDRSSDTASRSIYHLSIAGGAAGGDRVLAAGVVAENATHVAENATDVAVSATHVAESATRVAVSATEGAEWIEYDAAAADAMPEGGDWRDPQSSNRLRRTEQLIALTDAWTHYFPQVPISPESLKRLLQATHNSAEIALEAIQRTAEANVRAPVSYAMKVAQNIASKPRPSASPISLVDSPYGADGMRDVTDDDRAKWAQADEVARAYWGS